MNPPPHRAVSKRKDRTNYRKMKKITGNFPPGVLQFLNFRYLCTTFVKTNAGSYHFSDNLKNFINLFGDYVQTLYLCTEVLGSFRLVVSFRLVEGRHTAQGIPPTGLSFL